ncbi:MAG: alanine racemase [Actinoplanes sp.]
MTLLLSEPRATLHVDLDAVTANVRTIKSRTAGELMAVVKADGFGHGQVDVARAALAGGATRLGVTSIDEARPLRAAGLTEPILSWLNPLHADFSEAVRLNIELGVPGLEHLHTISRTSPGARLHLHLDTGLGRDGAEPARWERLCRAAREAERHGRIHVVGVMGHLPCADRPGHPANARGRNRFAWAVRVARAAGLRPTVHHLAATAATLSDALSHHTMSRIGAGLVGIDESATVRLRPALTLTAPLVTIRGVPAGTAVGYGHTWTAKRATRLGLIPVGYADGLPRLASGRAEVWVAGARRPVAGRISMDMTVVDLGPDSPATVGDPVTVFGPGDHGEPTTAQWAAWAETLEHEIVTGLSARLHRRSAA